MVAATVRSHFKRFVFELPDTVFVRKTRLKRFCSLSAVVFWYLNSARILVSLLCRLLKTLKNVEGIFEKVF